MKPTAILMILPLSLACLGQAPAPATAGQGALAQALSPAPPARAVSVEKPRLSREEIAKIEAGFELTLHNLNDAPEVIGACSGIYLSGYGVVFTTALNLVTPPRMGPFQPTPAPVAVHQRKLAQLPILQQKMREMLAVAAKGLVALPPDEKLVAAVRLFYLPGEDKSGLPDQIVMTADRASALAGNIQTEIQ